MLNPRRRTLREAATDYHRSIENAGTWVMRCGTLASEVQGEEPWGASRSLRQLKEKLFGQKVRRLATTKRKTLRGKVRSLQQLKKNSSGRKSADFPLHNLDQHLSTARRGGAVWRARLRPGRRRRIR